MQFITKQGDRTTPYVVEMIVDTEAEVKGIKATTFAPGSTVIALDTASVYMLNTDKEWKKL